MLPIKNALVSLCSICKVAVSKASMTQNDQERGIMSSKNLTDSIPGDKTHKIELSPRFESSPSSLP